MADINIYGTLKSQTGDGKLALASEIYDVAKGKFQSQINQNSADGIVYDVTTNNSGATFASLSALLSNANLSTLIPTSVRKGGMQIRFVQSSDNKYVQYRYMGTETTGNPNPFLDTTNWQGVDETPTLGSENLVKSGGVFNEFALKQDVIQDLAKIRQDASAGAFAYESQCIVKTNKDTAYYNNAGNDPNDQYNATLLGVRNKATGYGAFSGGIDCEAGDRAAVFNTANKATGSNSFASGSQSRAGGKRAFAHGYQCQASGENSIAMGTALLTQNDGEAAFGRFNNTGANIRFSVGGGSSASDRKNLLQINTDGTIYILLNGTPISLQECLNALTNRLDALQ